MAAVCETASDTDRPDCIEPVGILDTLSLECPHGLPDPCALERDRRHDLDDRLNEVGYIMPGLGDAGDKIFGTK